MRHITLATAIFGISSSLFAADPLLLNLVMPDAQVVAGVNVGKAKTSPFGQFLLRRMPEDGDFAKFINASGFDPRRDIQEVLMASANGQKGGLVAARGSFDASKIVALAVSEGKNRSVAYNGAQLLVPTDAAGHQTLAFFDSEFAVAGDLDTVKAAIDRRKAKNPVNPQLAAKVALYGAADAWTVSLVPLSGLAGKPGVTAGPLDGILQGDLLKKVSETSGSLTFSSPVRVTGELVTDSNQNATAIGDVVKFLSSMIQISGDGPGASVATLVQSLSVATEGNILKLGLAIPEEQLEALIQSAGKQEGKRSKHIERI